MPFFIPCHAGYLFSSMHVNMVYNKISLTVPSKKNKLDRCLHIYSKIITCTVLLLPIQNIFRKMFGKQKVCLAHTIPQTSMGTWTSISHMIMFCTLIGSHDNCMPLWKRNIKVTLIICTYVYWYFCFMCRGFLLQILLKYQITNWSCIAGHNYHTMYISLCSSSQHVFEW